MSCRKIRRFLSLYYRGELSKEKEELVTQHIQKCEGCAREAQAYKALNEATRGLEEFKPSADFELKLAGKIRELSYPRKEPKAKSLVTSFPSLKWAFIPAMVTVAALFLLLRGGFYKSQTELSQSGTDLVKLDNKLEESKKMITPMEDSFVQVKNQRMVPVDLLRERKEDSRAVYIMHNLRFSDLERLPDSRVMERRLSNYVMDAVNFRPVDDRQTNEVYVMPAVSTIPAKGKRSY